VHFSILVACRRGILETFFSVYFLALFKFLLRLFFGMFCVSFQIFVYSNYEVTTSKWVK